LGSLGRVSRRDCLITNLEAFPHTEFIPIERCAVLHFQVHPERARSLHGWPAAGRSISPPHSNLMTKNRSGSPIGGMTTIGNRMVSESANDIEGFSDGHGLNQIKSRNGRQLRVTVIGIGTGNGQIRMIMRGPSVEGVGHVWNR
jgi:hypothetical protein